MNQLRADPREIVRTLEVLFRPGDVFEVRIPKTHEGTVSGYFNSSDAAVKAITGMHVRGPGTYITINPVTPALLARAANRLKPRAATTTSDRDILTRRWLPVDGDPVRPADISSTDAEHELALERVREIRFELSEQGWPAPVLADSGNGGHLDYAVDLANDESSTKLIERCLKSLSARFSDNRVKVDEGIFNAGRLVKLYGTVAGKGDSIAERPHRLSHMIDVPCQFVPVPLQLLEELAATVKDSEPPRSGQTTGKFNIEAFLARHLQALPPVAYDGGRKWPLKVCPFNADHRAPDAAVFERADGSLAFNCFHSACSGRGWRDVRELFEGPRPQANRPNTAAAPPGDPVGSLITSRISDIEPRPVNWTWRGRIARGKVNLIAGNPGLGKSQITASIAAIVTTGGGWPVDRSACAPGDVIILSAEDDAADTLRPRLEAAGADLNRIHIIEGVVASYTGEGQRVNRLFSLQHDLQALEVKLRALPDVAVIVIDPISAYLGDTDSHCNAEVRGILAPLSGLAAARNVAAVVVSHLNKAASPDVLMRVTGSLAFVAAARVAYLVARDPQDKTRCLFLPMKNNLAPDLAGLAFRIEGATVQSPHGPIETSRVMWEAEPVTVTADEAMRPQAEPGDGPAVRQATEWLQWTLRDPTPAADVYRRATEMGISKATLRRAADTLPIHREKSGMTGGWIWSLPEGETDASKNPEDAQPNPEDAQAKSAKTPINCEGAQGAQVVYKQLPLSTFGKHLNPAPEDAHPYTHTSTFGNLEHLRQSKGLSGQNDLSTFGAAEHLRDEHLRDEPADDDIVEVEL